MTVGVGVLIGAVIRQVGKQVLLVVVRAEPALLLLLGVYLKPNSQVCVHSYLNKNSQAYLMEFRADSKIDHIG